MGLHYAITIYMVLLSLGYATLVQRERMDNVLLKKVYLVCSIGVMCLFTALRHYTIGNDTEPYRIIFSEICSNGLDFSSRTSVEPGFKVLLFIISRFTSDYQWVIALTALITYITFAKYIYTNCNNVHIATLLLYAMLYRASMSMMRQGIAIAIILIAIMLFQEGKKKRYFLLVAIAASIHYSASIFLIYPFLRKRKINAGSIIIILITSIILTRTNIPFLVISKLNGRFGSYLTDTEGGISLIFDACVYFIFLVVTLLLNRDEEGIISEEFEQYTNLLMWSSLLCIAFSIMSFKVSGLTRMTAYFRIIAISSFSDMLEKNKSKQTQIICFFTVAILLAYMTITLELRPDWNRIYPYYFFWQK